MIFTFKIDVLTLLEKSFEQIKWDNKVVDMARESDVEATFFYTCDETYA